jgi:hypothetical protein
METAEEYRQYARECMDWAEQAVSGGEREAFLHMARMWTQAASQIEAACGPRPEGDMTHNPTELPSGELDDEALNIIHRRRPDLTGRSLSEVREILKIEIATKTPQERAWPAKRTPI